MFTIKDLSEGRCAVVNDSSIANLHAVLTTAFPFYDWCIGGDGLFYYAYDKDKTQWIASNNKPNIPIQSVNDFMEEITKQNEFIPKFGDKVLVSQNNEHWFVRKFIANTNNEEYKYDVTDWVDDGYFFQRSHCLEFYKYVKPPKVIVSKRDIAIWKGCNVEDIQII